MQAAYWVGRASQEPLGRVAPHLYAEFEGRDLDPQSLAKALVALGDRHPMLRLKVGMDGRQWIDPVAAPIPLEVEDLRALDADERARRLAQKRRAWGHRRPDLAAGRPAAFSVSLLPDGVCRVHVDTDMLAIDPASMRIVMDDLARLYGAGTSVDEADGPTFFDWLDRLNGDAEVRRLRERDREWWRNRLAEIPPAPPLPAPGKNQSAVVRSSRLAATLPASACDALEERARGLRVTTSTLMLALFALAVHRATGAQEFRLAVPTFWRRPLVDKVDAIVGEFSNVLVLGVAIDRAESLAQFATGLFGQMSDLQSHQAYPGVSIMRDLSRARGGVETSPFVFTAGFDMAGGSLFSQRVGRVFGPMVHAISQGPGVVLDAQLVRLDSGLLINWDIRLDVLPEDWIGAMFDDYLHLVKQVAGTPDCGRLSLGAFAPASAAALPVRETPLTPLQKAYLLGRAGHLPLGGVAMQEFRAYRGTIDLGRLEARLADMVVRHESLRTHVDAVRLVQWISPEPAINYQVIDLSDRTEDAAHHHVDNLAHDFAHELSDLERSPWQVTAFRLPHGHGSSSADNDEDNAVVFLRFDALILDGRAIAALAVELFGGEPPPEPAASAVAAVSDAPAAKRAEDAAYWAKKLQDVDGPPQLPFSKPLSTIGTSRYARQSLTIEKARFTSLARIGARQGLFKNSVLTAVTLEVLSLWLNEGGLCVGLPVAPPANGALANRSSFIAVAWDRQVGDFAMRAARLQSDVLDGLGHLDFSGVDIARLLLSAHPGALALPVVITNGLNWPVAAADAAMQPVRGQTQTPQVAIDIRFGHDPHGNLVFDVDYARAAIGADIVGDLLATIDRSIALIVETDRLEVSPLEVVDLDHYRLNGAPTDFTCDPFLARIAGNLFDGTRQGTALITGARRMSYAELGQSVGRAMAGLTALGIGTGKVVAVCLPRGPEHTAVTLATALIGGIWVPIDAGSPPDRLDYLLRNCQPDLIVAAGGVTGFETVEPARLLATDAPADPRALTASLDDLSASDKPAYYLYTSGTTGKPKCVVVSNRATANVIQSTLGEWAVTPDDVFISVTPLHHDMSVFDVFGCLTAGATLVLPEAGEEKDAIRWNRLVAEHGVTIWCSVPAILEMLLACRQGDTLKTLRLVAQGGDYIKPGVIETLRQSDSGLRLISLGGPTETTIWSIWHEIGDADGAAIPYGHPLPANRYFILDEKGCHCPTGVTGRIHTEGVNVAIGYLEDGAVTQTDFVMVRDPDGQDVRAFRTGDRGFYRADGKIVFASRVNGYVKVRGVRVSLPDIENEFAKHPAISRVLVVDYGVEQHGEAAIGVLYVARSDVGLSTADLRGFARRHLPESHVPGRFLAVDDLPLSANGKPDRKRARSLLTQARDEAAARPVTHAVRPEQTGARQVLDIYLGVLGKQDAGCDDGADFLSLGLLPSHLKRISTRLHEELGLALSPQQLLRCRNVAEVQALLPAAPG